MALGALEAVMRAVEVEEMAALGGDCTTPQQLTISTLVTEVAQLDGHSC